MVVVKSNFVNSEKDKIALNPKQRVRHVYEQTVVQLPLASGTDDDDYIPEFRNIKTALNRKKREFYPPIPWRICDVDISGPWSKTQNNRTFMCYQDNRWGLVLFLTARNSRRLRQCDEIFTDGTFKSCPKPYCQVATLHRKIHDRVIPLAFCLLKGKETGLYRQMIRRIKDRVFYITGRHFNPGRVFCDFEIALVSAIETELPHSSVKGCYFHFTQSIWRRVMELG